MVSKFIELGLLPQFVQAVENMGFVDPTPIQQQAIPALLAGRDLIGQAQTGTGKTAAFMLPLLQNLDDHSKAVQALILTPTRELAKQVAEAAEAFSQETEVKILAVYGGQSYVTQKNALNRGVDVVVGTPGRLLDLIHQKVLNLSEVHSLVLDEADQMLEMGFIDDVESILKELANDRQVAMFSATMPTAIRKLADKYLKNPESISVSPERLTVAEIEQRFYRVKRENKFAALMRLLIVEDISSALIFARTKAGTQELADELIRNGFSAVALHGDLNQAMREQVMNRFKAHNVTLLVATDVAARGLDIENVSHVINYDFPQDAEDYVHRIGRTGRAGKTGIAITFLTPSERGRQKEVVSYTHQPAIDCSLPTYEEVEARKEDRLVEKLSEQLMVGVTPAERNLIEHLGEVGMNSMEIAVAALRMMRAGETKLQTADLNEPIREPRREKYEGRNDRSSSNSREKWNDKGGDFRKGPRSDSRSEGRKGSRKAAGPVESGMVRLYMNLGNQNGIRPGDVVGAIASEVGIPGKAIGEITIMSDHTLVDVSENHVSKVLAASTGKYQLRGKPVKRRLAD
jgi:ATP-dependent RNA helicase DeaD